MSWKEVILVAAIILSGCSSARRSITKVPEKNNEGKAELTERIIDGNLTSGNFNIIKAEVEITSDRETQKLIASVKYRNPGVYLLTIRNRTGIEAARVYINTDTVLINDRIYRRLYCGSNEYLLKKYGIATSSLPVVFGDFLRGLREVRTIKDCSEGMSEIQGYRDSKELWYIIDCNLSKVSEVSVSEKSGTAGINLKFSAFRNAENHTYPARIFLEDNPGKTKISVEIISVDFTDNREIEFIPGKNYERIILK